MYTPDPLSLIFKGNYLDKNRGTFGFNMAASCNYPEAFLGGEVLFENNYFYMNSSGPLVTSTDNFINFHGPANLTFKNNIMRVFHDSSV